MSINKTNKLSIIYDGESLTDNWNIDYVHFSLDPTQFTKKGKLIMGFGPSASGKTYWAKNIIELMNKQLNFPEDFISIDGGIQRSSSIVYQIIKNIPNMFNSKGFKNLMSSDFITSKSLFSSSKIKSVLKKYLKKQSENNISPNLYVPETLGSCATVFTKYGCSKKYKDYIDISNDQNWVALYIWQHKKNCDLTEKFKCNTVKKSGKDREIMEGKKYSSKAYKVSEKHGNKELFRDSGKVPHAGYRIRIHNSGGNYSEENNKKIYNKSIIELDDKLYNKIKNRKIVENKFNCIIIKINDEYTDKNPVLNF
tara:strand:+ start:32 stop:961 length:930 start_codon:yes stop_codon:yes gene_type:complete